MAKKPMQKNMYIGQPVRPSKEEVIDKLKRMSLQDEGLTASKAYAKLSEEGLMVNPKTIRNYLNIARADPDYKLECERAKQLIAKEIAAIVPEYIRYLGTIELTTVSPNTVANIASILIDKLISLTQSNPQGGPTAEAKMQIIFNKINEPTVVSEQ